MKSFTLYKKYPTNADAPWYFRFQFQGQRIACCLGTNDKKAAATRARLRYAEEKTAMIREDDESRARLRMRQPVTATLDQVFKAYATSPVDAGARTRHLNELALRKILRECGISTPPESTHISKLDDTIARTWFAQAKQQALAIADQSAQNTIYRSAISWFNQANSLFAAKALDWYKQHHCYSPGFEGFSKTGKLLQFSRLPKTGHRSAPEDVIRRTLDLWAQLEDRDMYLAIGHELAFGLRRGEVEQAQWGWWQAGPGYPVLDGIGNFKNGGATIRVRALDPWFHAMQTRVAVEGWRPSSGGLIIEGTPDDLFRAIGLWMRGIGWDTQKTNHALRAYAGSQVAMKYGIYDAQSWLRHSTVNVTEDHYSQYVKDFKPANLDEIPARWAVLREVPTLRVLPDKSEVAPVESVLLNVNSDVRSHFRSHF